MGFVLRRVFVFDEYTADFIFVVNSTKTNKRSFSLIICLFVCLFVLGFLSHSRIFHSYGDITMAANFDLCSALMVIEQWGFFCVPHLLWHGTSVYNGHLRGPVTLTPIAERLEVELSLPIFTTSVCRSWDSKTNLPPARRML